MKKMIVLLVVYLFAQNIIIAQERTIVNKNIAIGGESICELSKSIEKNDTIIYYLKIEHKYTKNEMLITLGNIDDAIQSVDNLLKQSQSLIPSSTSQQDFEVALGAKIYKVSMMTISKETIIIILPEGEIKMVFIPANGEMNNSNMNIFRIDRVGDTDLRTISQTNYNGWKALFAELAKEKKKNKKK